MLSSAKSGAIKLRVVVRVVSWVVFHAPPRRTHSGILLAHRPRLTSNFPGWADRHRRNLDTTRIKPICGPFPSVAGHIQESKPTGRRCNLRLRINRKFIRPDLNHTAFAVVRYVPEVGGRARWGQVSPWPQGPIGPPRGLFPFCFRRKSPSDPVAVLGCFVPTNTYNWQFVMLLHGYQRFTPCWGFDAGASIHASVPFTVAHLTLINGEFG